MSTAYKNAGVDIEAGYEAVSRMKAHVKKTITPGVMGGIGSFGGLFDLHAAMGKMQDPVLVSGTDGVGTKLKLAFEMDTHDSIGIDAVAMCVNDIITQGAVPLFFLDYIACGKLEPAKVADIVKGVSEGCIQSGCALIGGETAEMPGMYPAGEYDIAGFAVGAVEKANIITGTGICAGDVLIGLPSSGVHSNGFSLVRKVIDGLSLHRHYDGLPPGQTLGQTLLTPTRIYVKDLLALMAAVPVKGMAHITGGGFIENIPRIFPEGLGCEIQLGSWDVPGIFPFLQQRGSIPVVEMYNVFNMGIGMVAAVAPEDAATALAVLPQARQIGRVTAHEGVFLL